MLRSMHWAKVSQWVKEERKERGKERGYFMVTVIIATNKGIRLSSAHSHPKVVEKARVSKRPGIAGIVGKRAIWVEIAQQTPREKGKGIKARVSMEWMTADGIISSNGRSSSSSRGRSSISSSSSSSRHHFG